MAGTNTKKRKREEKGKLVSHNLSAAVSVTNVARKRGSWADGAVGILDALEDGDTVTPSAKRRKIENSNSRRPPSTLPKENEVDDEVGDIDEDLLSDSESSMSMSDVEDSKRNAKNLKSKNENAHKQQKEDRKNTDKKRKDDSNKRGKAKEEQKPADKKRKEDTNTTIHSKDTKPSDKKRKPNFKQNDKNKEDSATASEEEQPKRRQQRPNNNDVRIFFLFIFFVAHLILTPLLVNK